MKAKIKYLDHMGRGIAKINNKTTFIPNALIDEEVECEIIKEKKKYNIANNISILKTSLKRIEPKCPYFKECGGCSLQMLCYEDTLEYKKNKVQDIMSKYADLLINPKVIKNSHDYFYRNKISLKVVNSEIGYYKKDSHDLVAISSCKVASKAINKIILDLKQLQINNGSITLRCNYNDELLIIITTKDKVNDCFDALANKHKIVGIIINDTLVYGENKFIEIINKHMFEVSYNSFFQINPYITSQLFSLVLENIKEGSTVLDLCCGVGTLGITASFKAKHVYASEIVGSAIKNALINKKINKASNIDFCLGDSFEIMTKIKDKIDTIILDPPRKGINSKGLNNILDIAPSTIIYISCDPMTLARDLKILKEKYDVEQFYILDMFSYSYHVECVCLLNLTLNIC